jgi:hypothetical protein
MFGKEIFDLIKSESEKGSVELDALLIQSLKLQEAYDTILPKVTPKLIRDLFARLQENPHIKQPIYMIELFTKKREGKEERTNTTQGERFRQYLISISGGSIPASYDHDSHFVINMRLTFGILKALNDINFVSEICGDYTGTVTAVGAAREYRPEEVAPILEKQGRRSLIETHKEVEEEREHADDRQQQKRPNTIIASEDGNQRANEIKHNKNYLNSSSSYKTAIYSLIAIAGVASLVSLIVSGGILLPNTFSPSPRILKQTSNYGTVNGEVTGQVPAVGDSVTVYKKVGLVDSVEKSGGYTVSSVIPADGHFMFKLPSGVYRITVVYHDGKSQIIENYAVWPGSDTSLKLIH